MSVDQKGGDKNPPGTLFTPRFDRFFRTHERVMWQMGSLDFNTLRPELLTTKDIEGVKTATLVESHNPVYTQRLLEYFRNDQEMASFVVTWAYEEMKHYAVLRTYLEAVGKADPALVDNTKLSQELDATRQGSWGDMEMGFTRAQGFAYTMVQEQVTGRFYKRFAEDVKEPLLEEILRIISKDEYRHCAYYLEKGREELEIAKSNRREGQVLAEIDEVLLNFGMPGPTFILDWERRFQAGLAAAPVDLAAMRETVDKVGQLTGKMHLLKLATSRGFRDKIGNELGLDLSQVLSFRGS